MEIASKAQIAELSTAREKLSDERLGNLISAVGNHEAKAALLGLMQPGIIYARSDLNTIMLHAQGRNLAWRMAKGLPFSYCRHSLAPIGLVAQEVTTSGGLETIGYIKTDFGQEEGDSLGGLLLDLSLRYPLTSLQDIFGATVSPSEPKASEEGLAYRKRSPITRLRLFWELITSSLPIRNTDLGVSLGEDLATISTHVDSLSEKGIISYDSIGANVPFVIYRLSKDHPQDTPAHYSKGPTLAKAIYQIMHDNPDREFTLESVVQEYLKPLVVERVSSNTEFYRVLTWLSKQGYVERKKFGHGKQSEINLTDDQRQMLLDLVTILDQFQNQDPEIIAYGRRCMKEIIADPEKVSTLIRKAREHSYFAQNAPPEQTTSDLVTIISQNPQLTATQLREILTQRQARTITKTHIRRLLKLALTSGQITQKTLNGIHHFSVAMPPDQTKEVNETAL